MTMEKLEQPEMCSMADTRIIRVMSSKASAPYDRALYAPLAGRVERVAFPKSFPDDEAALRAALETIEIFHLHWPERFLDPDLITHLWLIEILQDMLRYRTVRLAAHRFGTFDLEILKRLHRNRP